MEEAKAAFRAAMARLPEAERRRMYAAMLRSLLDCPQTAQALEDGHDYSVAMQALDAEAAEVDAQRHADAVAAELLADVDL